MLKLIKRAMGGCVSNRALTTENSFRVTLIDDNTSTPISSGNLFVTSSNIQYYADDQIDPAYTWPLKYIRRYGHEKKVFTFEAGRKCPKGEGKFSFITTKAEKVFNAVETSLTRGDRIIKQQNSTDENNAQMSTLTISTNGSSPRATLNSGTSIRTVSTSSSDVSPNRQTLLVHNTTLNVENQPNYVNLNTQTAINMQFKKSSGKSPPFINTKIAPNDNINNSQNNTLAFTQKENYVTYAHPEHNTYINAAQKPLCTYVDLEFGPVTDQSNTIIFKRSKYPPPISDYTELDHNTTHALRETIRCQEQERKSLAAII